MSRFGKHMEKPTTFLQLRYRMGFFPLESTTALSTVIDFFVTYTSLLIFSQFMWICLKTKGYEPTMIYLKNYMTDKIINTIS